MKLFMAGGESRHWIHDELLEGVKKNEMRIYLAGENGKKRIIKELHGGQDATIPRRGLALAKWGGV